MVVMFIEREKGGFIERIPRWRETLVCIEREKGGFY